MALIEYSSTDQHGDQVDRLFESDEAEMYEGERLDDDWERLYRVEPEWSFETGQFWVLNKISFELPEVSTYTAIAPEEAHAWLKANDYKEAAERYFERPRGGRPKIGERLITTAPVRVHNEIAELAKTYEEEVPDTIRRLLLEALEYRRIINAPDSRSGR